MVSLFRDIMNRFFYLSLISSFNIDDWIAHVISCPGLGWMEEKRVGDSDMWEL